MRVLLIQSGSKLVVILIKSLTNKTFYCNQGTEILYTQLPLSTKV